MIIRICTEFKRNLNHNLKSIHIKWFHEIYILKAISISLVAKRFVIPELRVGGTNYLFTLRFNNPKYYYKGANNYERTKRHTTNQRRS